MKMSRRQVLRTVGMGAGLTGLPSLVGAAVQQLGTDTALAGNSAPRPPLRLDRNENPWGPSSRALAALRDDAGARAARYPQDAAAALRDKLASVHRTDPERIVLGCGSTELVRMAVDAFVGARRKLVMATPSFDLPAARARQNGGEVVQLPLAFDCSHDLEGMLAACDATTGLVYISNPQNPTGSVTKRSDLEAFIRRLHPNVHVLIDEAYCHYAGDSTDYRSFIDVPLDDERVIVTRTFSAVYGLAGLRVGYAVAAAPAAARLGAGQLPDGVNVLGAVAAAAALEDVDHVRTSVIRNGDERQEFYNQANARMLRVIDSHANFVMLDVEPQMGPPLPRVGRRAAPALEHFGRHAVILPPIFMPFDRHLRVSLGTPADMWEFWRAWDLMPGHRMNM